MASFLDALEGLERVEQGFNSLRANAWNDFQLRLNAGLAALLSVMGYAKAVCFIPCLLNHLQGF
mgnify:CR=1 FL=1